MFHSSSSPSYTSADSFSVFLPIAFINDKSNQDEIILEPPFEINGNVTPVSGKRSVEPKMLSEIWKSHSPAADTAAIAK